MIKRRARSTGWIVDKMARKDSLQDWFERMIIPSNPLYAAAILWGKGLQNSGCVALRGSGRKENKKTP